MFEKTDRTDERSDRSKLIMVGSAAAVLLVIALLVVVGSRSSGPAAGETDMVTRESPDFESYRESIEIDMSRKDDRVTAQNLLGNYVATLKARVRNKGDRIIIGLKLRAFAVGLSQELLVEKVITPVPRVRETLGPGETLPIEIQLDRIPPPDEIQDMRIELHAYKLN
jgi:hypothetical protein